MTRKRAIEICKEMQLWRRGQGKYDEVGAEMPYEPKEFGEAIDVLIEFTETTIKSNINKQWLRN